MELQEELRAKWKQASAAQEGGTEWRAILLSIRAPIRVLAALREPDTRVAILFEAPLAVAGKRTMRLQADGISVIDQRRADENIVRIAVVLEQEALRDVFEVLAVDLAEVAARTATADAAIDAVGHRLEAWQACLRVRRHKLSREQQIGLLGELSALRLIGHEIGLAAAVQAWQGPLDGIQDFALAGHAVEVKSILGVGTHLRISHLDQLRTEGLRGLVLARFRFREGTDGSSLIDVTAALRSLIDQAAPQSRSDFDHLLLRAGYLDGDREDFLRVVLTDTCGYDVRDEFPRLTSSLVPAGIIDANYTLDERALAPFALGDVALSAFIIGMKGPSV